MRKFILLSIGEVILWAGGALMDLLNIAPLETVQWVSVIFVFSVIAFVIVAWPEIRLWMDGPRRRTTREYQRYKKDVERQRLDQFTEQRKRLEDHPWAVDVRHNFEKGYIEATARPPRTWWRYGLRRALGWAANRPWWVEWRITERIFNWCLPKLRDRLEPKEDSR